MIYSACCNGEDVWASQAEVAAVKCGYRLIWFLKHVLGSSPSDASS